MNDERQFYRDFKYGYYDFHNPELWKLQNETQSIRDKVRKAIGQNYELQQTGISLIGDPEQKVKDDALKVPPVVALDPVVAPAPAVALVPVPISVHVKNVIDSWLYIEDFFKANIKNRQDKPYILVGDLVKEYDMNGEEIDGTEKIQNIRIGVESLILTDAGKFLHARTGQEIKATDEILYVLLAPSGAVIEELINRGTISDNDALIASTFMRDIGLFVIPEGRQQRDNILNGITMSKLRILRKFLVLNGAGLAGAGIRRNYTIKYFSNPDELIERLSIVMASIEAGNTSNASKNEANEILQKLLVSQVISKAEFNGLMKKLN